MSELSKQALKVENNTSFPNNNNGEISAADLRGFNVNMIDSLVDEIGYNIDSASWNQQIDALEQFTSSQQPSFTALNQFTASQLTINSGVNTFTQSANGRLTALENETANLEAFTSSINQIADNGVVQGTSTRLHFSGLVSASIVPNVNGPIASIFIEQDETKLNTASFNQYTASTNADLDSIHQTTQSLNSFTASLQTAFVSTASFNAYTQSINSYTASNNDKWNILGSQSGSWVTETESGSFLITASFNNGTRNLTFTKGDASTFAVNIPDASGSAGDFVTTASFNSYTQSNDVAVDALESSASLALTTASFAAGTLTFTKGNGTTFGVVIPDISGSTIDTGSFATTGSNSFIGNQNVHGRVIISGSSVLTNNNYLLFTRAGGADIFRVGVSDNGNTYDFAVTGSTNQQLWLIDNQGGTYINTFTAPIIAANNVRLEAGFTASLQEGYAWVGNATNKNAQVPTSSFGGSSIPAGTISGSAQITALGFVSSSVTGSSLVTASVAGVDITFTKGDGSTFTIQVATGSFTTTASFNAYTQSTDARLNNIEAATASYVTETESGSFLITASFDNTTRNLSFTKGDTTTFILGGFATTGSNVFSGTETLQDAAGNFTSLHPISGGFYVVARGSNSASAHISSSNASLAAANGLTNIVFKTNNNTADTILSGSSNIFTNPGAPTAGFKRYLTAGNLSLIGALPQISGNMAFSPTITGNIFAASSVTTNPITIRGPISSSTYTISNNISAGGALNLGTSAANNFEQAVNGLNINNNLIGGTFGFVANRTRLTQTISFGGNQVQGVATFNMNSSSIDSSTSLYYGTNTFNNNSSASARVTTTGNAVGIYQSAFFGANTMTFSGSNDPSDAGDVDYNGGIYRSLIVGTNTPFVLTGPTGSNSLTNTGIIGNGLIVTGSNGNPIFAGITTGHGSLFTGRFNADGTRNRSSENVFVVGTGTSTTARKTGFLIDSGSNTFVEGTFNVSGSSTLSGSLYIQSGSTLPVSTGSAILTWNASTGQVSQTPLNDTAEFWSNTTQSGSAGVSGSIQFNSSGSVYGVSLVSGSRLQVENSGVFNVQFSAQIETSAGADTVYLWFKKNGTNLGDSASKALLANNTAQVMTVNILDEAVANDYYEVAYQTLNGNATILAEAASGNIPAIPSVIATVFQIR